jgi:uncharacterized protein (DUF1778 family)
MATPPLSFRLKKEQRLALIEVAKINGNPSVSAFLREMIQALCGPKQEEAEKFALRLMERAGQQMQLHLAEVEEAKERIQALSAKDQRSPKKRAAAIRGKTGGRRALPA